MTTTLNATTSNGLVVTPDNSGNVVLQYNGVAAPAFSAYSSGVVSLPASTFTKIPIDTEEFDTANCFNTSTYRFTPTVAGYYQVNGNIQISASTTSYNGLISLFKNGSRYKDGQYSVLSTNTSFLSVSSLIYLNGTTDYVELYGYQNSGGSLNSNPSSTFSYLNGCLLRGA